MNKMTKRLFILGAMLFTSINFLLAQITFQKTFGGTGIDNGLDVQQTSDGGYIITGSTYSYGAGSEDVYLIKTDVNGDTLWTKTLGATGDDWGRMVQQTTDGGYIITGFTNSFGTGSGDVYLIKTDTNGNPLWTKTFGGTNDDYSYSVQQTTDGGYIIAGWTWSFGAGSYDVYLIKIDVSGNSVWTKTFGRADNDQGVSVLQTTDWGFIITGYTKNPTTGYADVYLIKTDSSGNSLWTKTYGGTNSDYGNSVKQTTDGGYIIIGYSFSFGVVNANAYLIKTDANGDTLWTKTYGGTGAESGTSVEQTTDGGYIFTGWTNSFGAGNFDVYLIKTDTNGDTVWTKTFGGTNDDKGLCVQQTTDGGYIITAYTTSFGAGTNDIYLIKTDANGNSGCSEGNTASIITTPITQVATPATIFSSPGTIVTAPALLVGSGSVINTICTTVDVQEITINNSFSISPNPSAENFSISFEEMILNGKVEIINMLGETVFAENIFNESKKEINLKNISSGIYFVKVFDGEKSYCKKLIVDHD